MGEGNMTAKMKLGEILVKAGLLTDLQLRNALAEQKTGNLKLGQYLVREGIVDESRIVALLAEQLQIEKYGPDKFAVDSELKELIPPEMAYRYQLVPLKKIEMLLTVATTDPLDIEALDAVERYAKTEVEPVICTEQHLTHLLNRLYGSFGGIGGMLEGLQISKEEEKTEATEDIEMHSLQNMAEEAPVVALVNSIISQAIRDNASDVHISPQKSFVRVRFRVDGKLFDVPAPPKKMFLPIVSRLKILSGMDIAVSRVPQDGRFTVRIKNKDINIRASTIPSIYGENVVLRLLDTSRGIYSLQHLGMSAADRKKIESVIARPYGMILSTGPTGSGKSTSLYAILRQLNQPDINIVTVEDPVEYRIENIMQVQLNTKAGMTFAEGLRSILRQDPDVVMVGEIRDYETAGVAVQAALTGHRVLSSLHTNDAASAVTRLIEMGIQPFLVSSVMAVSFAQRLVRTICPDCKTACKPPEDALKFWGLTHTDDANFSRGKGCINCMHTGYRGRTGIYEVLVVDETIQDMIFKKKPAHVIANAAIASGRLTPMKENAAGKIKAGITTLAEAASAVML
jgi:type IV pilus assembly protein PilB